MSAICDSGNMAMIPPFTQSNLKTLANVLGETAILIQRYANKSSNVITFCTIPEWEF